MDAADRSYSMSLGWERCRALMDIDGLISSASEYSTPEDMLWYVSLADAEVRRCPQLTEHLEGAERISLLAALWRKHGEKVRKSPAKTGLASKGRRSRGSVAPPLSQSTMPTPASPKPAPASRRQRHPARKRQEIPSSSLAAFIPPAAMRLAEVTPGTSTSIVVEMAPPPAFEGTHVTTDTERDDCLLPAAGNTTDRDDRQMRLQAGDISFHSNIPVPLDITVAVVYSVFGVCSLLGNTTLLYVSYKKKHLLKPAEYFIINLAVSDLGLTLSLYPMAITSSFYHRWLYGKTVCCIYAFCGMLFGICSLTTLTLLSVVCFAKVCYPFYGNRFNSAHGRLLIACAWVYALLFACFPLAHWGEYGPEPYGTACCIDWRLSNQRPTARSYTVALFVLCYILPCCTIVASYTGILVTVHTSRKTVKQHATRQTHMSSIQLITVKLSVAVCIGFFAAWSPYAVVSMWAAFGHVENIPPLAFALPAMFAKSSTIYNPIIYLLLRPNFRRIICSRDVSMLCCSSPTGCICPQSLVKCCTKPKIRLDKSHRQTSRFLSDNFSVQPPIATVKEKSNKVPKRFGHSPQICCVADLTSKRDLSKDQESSTPQTERMWAKMSLMTVTRGQRTVETENFSINVEMASRHTKLAWP
ncbi:uncharacterized protein KZ484_021241 [Pholidichthys leucotaenia]